MQGLFKVISVGELRKGERRSFREVVLKSFEPRSSQNGLYVGHQAFACTIFGDDAERWTIGEGNYVSAELSFNVRKSERGYFQSISIIRYVLMTESDWTKGLELPQQQSQQEPETL